MANFESVPTKRKLAQLEEETQFSSNKKIKAENYSNKENTCSILDLPPEILHDILSFFSNDTQRRRIRSVCRLWFDYINYNEFKIGVLLASEVDEFSRCFGRYQKPIGLKFMKLGYLNNLDNVGNKTLIKSCHVFHSMLCSLTQLTALNLQLIDFEVPQELTNLQSLTLLSPTHKDTILRLTNLRRLKTCCQLATIPTTLESLYLNDIEERNVTIDRAYSRLTELIISMTTRCEIPDSLTNLRKLVFEPGSTSDGNQMNLMKFPNLEELIANVNVELLPDHYPSTLTKLHVYSHNTVEINENLTQLKDLECFAVKLHSRMNSVEDCVVYSDNETILKKLDAQKVTKLKTKLVQENCHIWYRRFTNLIDLDISLDEATSAILPYISPLTRLTQLKVDFDIYPHQLMTELPNIVNLNMQKSREFYSTPELINFGTMHHLTSLELSGSYNSISVINLTNLLSLKIYNGDAPAIEIHGLSTATNLTGLSVCNLRGSSSTENFTELALLTNLRVLSLFIDFNTEMINIADLTTLQLLTYLEVRALSQSTYYLTRLSRLQQVKIGTNEPNKVDKNGILKGLPLCYRFGVTEVSL